jgi:hypothetical protein
VTHETHNHAFPLETHDRLRAEPGFARARPPDDSTRNPAEGGGSRGNPGFPRVAARLNEPRPALVEEGFDGAPGRVNRQPVAVVREEWRVLDRWWTEEPISRRYFEVVLDSGQNVVVFRDRELGGWFSQRGA